MENNNHTDPNEPLVRNVLQKIVRERASSQKYNVRALVLIYSALAIVILLQWEGAGTALTAIAAITGLGLFLLYTWLQGKRLEKKLFDEGIAYYKELTANPSNNGQAVGLAEQPLTERELQILSLIARGNMNKEIASALGLSRHTIRNHVAQIFRKLEVDDRTSAVLLAISRGWIKGDYVQRVPSFNSGEGEGTARG